MTRAHRRWQALRGESTDPKDMIFSVRKWKIMQMKTKLSVVISEWRAPAFHIRWRY